MNNTNIIFLGGIIGLITVGIGLKNIDFNKKSRKSSQSVNPHYTEISNLEKKSQILSELVDLNKKLKETDKKFGSILLDRDGEDVKKLHEKFFSIQTEIFRLEESFINIRD